VAPEVVLEADLPAAVPVEACRAVQEAEVAVVALLGTCH
jgi:hypothetical protein